MRTTSVPATIGLATLVLLMTHTAVDPAWAGTDVGNGMPAGITRGQTARLNVLHPPDPFLPPDPCRVALAFFDAAGAELAARTVSVARGHLALLDVSGDDLLRDPGVGRIQLYGLVAVRQADRRACRGLVATLEVFDNETLRTTVVVHPPDPIVPR